MKIRKILFEIVFWILIIPCWIVAAVSMCAFGFTFFTLILDFYQSTLSWVDPEIIKAVLISGATFGVTTCSLTALVELRQKIKSKKG